MDLNYYKLTTPQRLLYKLKKALVGIGKGFVNFWIKLAKGIIAFFVGIYTGVANLIKHWWNGDALTKVSYFIMGTGHIFRGQIIRGIINLLLEVGFVAYMIAFGGNYLAMFFENFFTGGNVGRVETYKSEVWNEELGEYTVIVGDNSFHVVLYGILTIFIIIFFVMFWISSVKESYALEQMKIVGKKCKNFKEDIKEYMDGKFHITLLSLPLVGLLMFTVVPLVTMILIAFTNYDKAHEVPEKLFQWVGFDNFKNLFAGNTDLTGTFWRVLSWTLIWAVFATFTSYFIGMLLAMLINKKGIKLKKFYRTLFVATIAVPQFVSLLIMSKMLDTGGGSLGSGGGIITQWIENIFGYHLQFGLDINTTRLCIIFVNMWVGVPYSMLMCSGILMNIPDDLYESARIDGASPARQFRKITLPYMLFVTGPYLITQFIGNINNFNVIYLLSGGGPGDIIKYTDGAKGTDLLITWLYKLSLGADRDYKLASVIGILVFVISAVFSLIVYNRSSAVKGEDNFQ